MERRPGTHQNYDDLNLYSTSLAGDQTKCYPVESPIYARASQQQCQVSAGFKHLVTGKMCRFMVQLDGMLGLGMRRD